MSTEIEKRVVQMEFDNKKFESNTRETMKTLENLKSKLNFDKVKSTFSTITAEASKVNLAGMTKSIETVNAKFSAMEAVAFATFSRITNSAITMGTNLVKSFTIDPIMQGLSEYETKMGSIQTILTNTSAKGTTMADVTAALNELNEYSDKTIYNFQEMTRNIGTFTAAGVDLDTSTAAIKGIANLAAASGSNSQQASTAMYQLSQALSSGRVALQDWNSIVNAGMGGELFQNALKETAKLHGVNVDAMIEKEGSFRETLTKNAWLTSDVLTETLAKFTGDLSKEQLMAKGYTEAQADEIVKLGTMANDAATKVKTFSELMTTLKETAQSGWATTFEILFGNFEEAKELFTGISDSIGGVLSASANARNNLLQGWKDLGGRSDILKGLSNIFTNLWNVVSKIGEAFREVFPPTTAEQLKNISGRFVELTENLMLSENALGSIKAIAKILFSIAKVVGTVLAIPLKFIPVVLEGIDGIVEAVLKLVGPLASVAAGVLGFISNLNVIPFVTDGIVWAVEKVVGAINWLIDKFHTPISSDEFTATIPLFGMIRDKASEAMGKVGEFAGSLKESFMGFDWAGSAQKLVDGFQSIMTKSAEMWVKMKAQVYTYFTYFKEGIRDFVDWVNWDALVKAFTGIVSSKIFLDLASFLKNMGKSASSFSSIFEGLGDGVKDTMDSVQSALSTWQTGLKVDILKQLAAAILMIAGAVLILSMIDTPKLIVALGGITVMIITLTTVMAIVDKCGIEGGRLAGLISMSFSILILASAIKKIGQLDPINLAASVAAIGALMFAMVGYSYLVGKNAATISKANVSTVIFATGMLVLASAVLKLTNIPYQELAVGIAGIMALTAVFAIASEKLAMSPASNKASFKMIALAGSIKEMSKAVKIMSEIPFTSMVKGLIGVTALLGGVVVAMNLMNNVSTVSSAIGLMILAGSLIALAGSLKVLSMIAWSTMLDGLTKISLLLVGVGVALRTMPLNMISIGIGLDLVALSLFAISTNIAILGNMDWITLIKGMIGLGGALTAIAIGLTFMTGTLPGSAALLVASGALIALSGAMAIVGNLNLWTIIKSLAGLGAVLLILGGSATLLVPLAGVLLGVSGGLLAFSGALLVLGGAITLIGAGLTAFAIGLGALGAAVIGSVNLIVETLEHMARAIINLIPLIAEGIGKFIAEIVVALARYSGAIVEGFVIIAGAIIDALVELIPKITDGVLKVMTSVLKSMVTYAPDMTKYFAQWWIAVMNNISTYAGDMIQASVDALVAIFKGIADALKSLNFDIIKDVIFGATMFAVFLGILSMLTPLIPSAMLGLLGFSGVIAELMIILALVGGLYQLPGLKWLIEQGGAALETLGGAIGGFFGAIVGGMAKVAAKVLPDIGRSLAEFMTEAKPFFDGVNMINPATTEGVRTLADAMLIITASGILDGLTKFITGGNSLVDFGKQLAEFAPYYASYANSISGISPDTIESTSNALKSVAEFAKMAPKIGGIGEFFVGKFSLSTFGEQLAEFAPYIKMYAETVKGIDTSGVEASTNAGKMITAMADTIPNMGGALAALVGENSLSLFGKEMADFAPYIKTYADSVKGIDTSGVEASANAGKMLSDLANTLPNSGGALSLLVGDNTLSKFSKYLLELGPAIKEYATQVAGISYTDVTSSVQAATEIASLYGKIPLEFESLGGFGKEMVNFGEYVGEFYEEIQGIDPTLAASSISTVQSLVALMSSMAGVDLTVLSTFSTNLEQVSKDGVSKFVEAFNTGEVAVIEAVNGFINVAVQCITTKTSEFAASGETMMITLSESLINGVTSATTQIPGAFDSVKIAVEGSVSSITSTVVSMMDGMVSDLSAGASEFTTCGVGLVSSFAKGISSAASDVTSAGKSVAEAALSGASGQEWQWENIGANAVAGFARGISNNTWSATAKATEMAKAAAEAAKKELEIHSPSRITKEIGSFFVQGFSGGISDNMKNSTAEAGRMATNAKDALKNSLRNLQAIMDDDLDCQPVITPVLDMSNMGNIGAGLDTMLSVRAANNISRTLNRQNGQNEPTNTDSNNSSNVSFVQNNYSPKALSSVEIYRQTKNQFSRMKGVLV